MKIGYARVSTQTQSVDNQVDKLSLSGCDKVFVEKYTGATTKGRKQLQEAIAYLRDGDSLVVTKLDRLARSATDLGNIARELQSKDVDLVVLDQQIDTSTPSGQLMFTMIGAFAEFERDLIRSRCSEGIKKAKDRGVKFGRTATLSDEQQKQLHTEFNAGLLGKGELASKYGISRSSVYRLAKKA
jgi:DNA invertase Pin-like site-specific DNA recombinase